MLLSLRRSFQSIRVRLLLPVMPALYVLKTVFPGTGASTQSLLGIVMIAIGVILGASLVPPSITQLVTASATSGITTSADALVDVGQLVAVIALAVAPSLAGMFVLFKDVRS